MKKMFFIFRGVFTILAWNVERIAGKSLVVSRNRWEILGLCCQTFLWTIILQGGYSLPCRNVGQKLANIDPNIFASLGFVK